jgi:predicted enzyme related to lactoylglutathione lyase
MLAPGLADTPDSPSGTDDPAARRASGDLEATLGRATRKGAKVVSGPMEVPGGGRIAQLTDPQGAVFALHQAPRT